MTLFSILSEQRLIFPDCLFVQIEQPTTVDNSILSLDFFPFFQTIFHLSGLYVVGTVPFF